MNLKLYRINQKDVKHLKSPYDQLMDRKGPHIAEKRPRSVVIFDGWQNLPPQRGIDPEKALENAFVRAISIQRHQARKGLVYFDKILGREKRLQNSDILDPFKMREEEQKRLEMKKHRESEESEEEED